MRMLATSPQDVGQIPKPAGLHAVDYLLLVLYAGGTIVLGWYYGRKQKSTKEYFVGSGKMNPILIGVSLFATLLSTISYLSSPGEAIGKGPVWLSMLLALPLVYVVVAYVLLPVYKRQKVTSAYELLEAKLGVSVRLLGAVMFLALRLVWMSLLIAVAAKAMAAMLGASAPPFLVLVAIIGLVSIIYTSLGGLRAVVITDTMQTILLFGGALLVLGIVTVDFAGFGWFPTTWQSSWDSQPIFSTDPSTRVTIVGTVLTVFTWYVATSGGDQTSVQRFMATEDLRAARRAFATQLIVAGTVIGTLFLVGFALLGYFQAHPDQLPKDLSLKDDADKIFPHFIGFHLPVGIAGLVVAAMFAAAMSSVDSGVNSITAVVMTDFLDRFGMRPATERSHMIAARCLAFAVGLIVILFSVFADYVPGNITAATNKSVNLLTTPIFALFVYALFVPFAHPIGAWAGTVVGIATAALIAFSGPIFNPQSGRDPVSFQWAAPVALSANLCTGIAISWILHRIHPKEELHASK